jgi:putative transposase
MSVRPIGQPAISEPDPVLRCFHPAYIALGTTADERASIYRSMLKEALSDDDLHAIRIYLQQQRALGCDSFRAMIEAKARRFANVRPAHRPACNK